MSAAAASAARSKERTPEHYCAARRCLWRVYDARTDTFTPCGNHPSLPVGKITPSGDGEVSGLAPILIP